MHLHYCIHAHPPSLHNSNAPLLPHSLLLITIPIGLAVRYLPLGLPWFLYKYFGSILWAIALYWFLAALLPKLRPLAIATLAITIATVLELSRLIPIAPIDAFRLTLAGQILLGRYFSVKNIAAYILAIILTATLDHLFSFDIRISSHSKIVPNLHTPNPTTRDTL